MAPTSYVCFCSLFILTDASSVATEIVHLSSFEQWSFNRMGSIIPTGQAVAKKLMRFCPDRKTAPAQWLALQNSDNGVSLRFFLAKWTFAVGETFKTL
jgi:hypothetical protein